MEGSKESQRVLETIRRVMGRVASVRVALEALRLRVESVMGDVRLSEQGREEEVERILLEGRPAVEAEIHASRLDINAGVSQAEQRLSELTEVSPEALAARAAVLSPVLGVAFENPEALLNTYRRRFGNPTDRRLLEESAQVVIDGRAGSDGGQLEYDFNALQEELSVQRPSEERQALSDRSELLELASYLDSAERVVQADLDALRVEEVSSTVLIARENAVAEVNRYESMHASA